MPRAKHTEHEIPTPHGGLVRIFRVGRGWAAWEWSATRRAMLGDRPTEPQYRTLSEARAAVDQRIAGLRALLTCHEVIRWLGAQGGKARAEKLSAERRSEIARAAARARWSREKRKAEG